MELGSQKISIQQIINSNNVKYTLLGGIINEAFSGSSADNIEIYIDVYSMTKALYASHNYIIDDYISLSSCLINMCAHYREFFRTRYKVESRFYLVYSKNAPYINTQFYPEYNSKTKYAMQVNAKVFDMIEHNMKMLEMLCKYLPDIFFIPSEFETGLVIYDLMCRQDPESKNGHMVITKDPYCYQLVNMKPQTIILRTKPKDGSYYIKKETLIDTYLGERLSNSGMQYGSRFSELYTVILALSGIKERSMTSIFNINRVLNMLSKAILDNKILDKYTSDVKFIWDAIYDRSFKIGFETFEFRFKAIDIQFQHLLYFTSAESLNMSFNLVNLDDPDAVRAINNEHYKACPIHLNSL